MAYQESSIYTAGIPFTPPRNHPHSFILFSLSVFENVVKLIFLLSLHIFRAPLNSKIQLNFGFLGLVARISLPLFLLIFRPVISYFVGRAIFYFLVHSIHCSITTSNFPLFCLVCHSHFCLC